jgi:hypothetical protein
MLPSAKLKESSSPQELVPNSKCWWEVGVGEEEEGCRQNATGGTVVVIVVLNSHEYSYDYTVNTFLKYVVNIIKVHAAFICKWTATYSLLILLRMIAMNPKKEKY